MKTRGHVPVLARSGPLVLLGLLAAACGGKGGPGASGAAGTSGDAGDAGSGATGGAQTGGSTGGGAAGAAGDGGGSAIPPSCQSTGPGLSDCGPGGEICCVSPKVTGGTFFRTYDSGATGATNTTDPATVSDFRLDKYLVTVARFRRFVAAWDQGAGYLPGVGSGKHAHLNGGQGVADSGAPGAYEAGWAGDTYNRKLDLTNDTLDCQAGASTWTSTAGANENLPMNCVNWFEAYAFCIWDGGFLPSEAEYVYAAAGGSEQRLYPWGSTAPGTANQYAIYACNFPAPGGSCDGTNRNIAPVGTATMGAGRWGHLDLVGNLIEWNLDWFAPAYGNPCTDCANLATGSGRSPRDGSFSASDERLLRSSYRNNGFYPANRSFTYGFRCARAP